MRAARIGDSVVSISRLRVRSSDGLVSSIAVLLTRHLIRDSLNVHISDSNLNKSSLEHSSAGDSLTTRLSVRITRGAISAHAALTTSSNLAISARGRAKGALTEEEFEREKRRVLGPPVT